ncbi:MAG TPA: hypothetical protein PKA27_05820 [Fimbriimonadaceae bacterium]|nr:hypothetical protein [Fimbriimonadaceae bacterium]
MKSFVALAFATGFHDRISDACPSFSPEVLKLDRRIWKKSSKRRL